MSDVRIDRLANALLLELHEPFQVHERFAIVQKYLTEASELQPKQLECDTKQIHKLLYGIVDVGCSCDALNGYSCAIHKVVVELRNLLKGLLVQQDSIPPSEGGEAIGSTPAEATIPQADGCSVAPWSNT